MSLLERGEELARLTAAWAQARGRRGSMVVVSGEPGTGKTSVVQDFVDRLVTGEAAVLWGACDPLSTPRPLGPLHDLEAQLDEVTRSRLRNAAPPHEIFAGVFEQLRESPTVLVVDDLHWADQGTIDLLRFLLRRLAGTPSVVVGTVRPQDIDAGHPLRGLLGDVAHSPDAATLALQPLTLAAITTMIGDRPIDPRRIERITGGNPFFVSEMLEHRGDDLPVSVRDAILARTVHFEEATWDVAHLLACAPEAMSDDLLAGLGIGIAPLRALDGAGLIRRGARGVAFRHDLCRLAIASTLPPGGEVALHRRMLGALEASGAADPSVLAHHAINAADGARVLRHATDAGRAASRSGAHTQAAAFFRVALEQRGRLTPAEEATLLECLAEECYLIDELPEAISACERAMALRRQARDVAGVSSNHQSLSVYHWYNAERDVAERHASEAAAVLDGEPRDVSGDDAARLGHAFAMQAYLALQSTDLPQAMRLVARARDIATSCGDPALATRAALIAGSCAVLAGDDAGRRRMVEILASAPEHLDEVYSSGYSNLTYLDVEQRRLQQATEVLDVSLPLTVERDLPICRVWQLGSRGRLQLIEGDWDGALVDADAVLVGRSAPLARTWPFLVRGLIALRRFGDAQDDLDQAWQLACRFGEPLRLLPAAAALVEQAWLTNRPDERVDGIRSLLRDEAREGLEWSRGDLAVWLHRLDGSVGHLPGPVAEPQRLELAGDARGAAERWEALGAPYEQALGLVHSADAQDVRSGLDRLDRLGADAVAGRVRLGLRARGVATIPSRRRSSTLTNTAGLTAREIEVLQLLDGGFTNAELADQLYISPKTVDHHVSSILSKLQVGNRREAVRAGRRHHLIP